MRSLVAWALLLSAAAAEMPKDQPFRIAGSAVDAVTGKPLKHLPIVLTTGGPPGREISRGPTTEDGRFDFVVPQGTYHLRAERSGLPPQSYGAHTLASMMGVAVITGPGQDTSDLVFRVLPGSAISGIIKDEAGDPVEDALVQLVTVMVPAGRKVTANAGFVRSNDLGEYRFGGIPSGKYFLAVTGKPWYADTRRGQSRTPANTPKEAFAPAYHPNTPDPAQAVAITVKPGEEAKADFRLRTTIGYTLSLNVETGDIATTGVNISLTGEGVGGTPVFSHVQRFYAGKRIASVPPGRYRLRVSGADPTATFANQPVDVPWADTEVSVKLVKPPSVSGSVVLANGSSSRPAGLSVVLHDETSHLAVTRPVDAKGTFRIPAVPAGKYRVHVMAGTARAHLSSVSVGETIGDDGQITVAAENVENVVASAVTDTGRVKGFVYRDGKPVPGVLVVLGRPGSPDHLDYAGFQTDSDGSFDFEHVPVGEHRMFVTTDFECEYANPAVSGPLLAAGLAVKVESGSVLEQRLVVP